MVTQRHPPKRQQTTENSQLWKVMMTQVQMRNPKYSIHVRRQSIQAMRQMKRSKGLMVTNASEVEEDDEGEPVDKAGEKVSY
jgi:hypothetical protein